MMKAKKIYCLDEPLYNYIITEASLTKSSVAKSNMVKRCINTVDIIRYFLEKNSIKAEQYIKPKLIQYDLRANKEKKRNYQINYVNAEKNGRLQKEGSQQKIMTEFVEVSWENHNRISYCNGRNSGEKRRK